MNLCLPQWINFCYFHLYVAGFFLFLAFREGGSGREGEIWNSDHGVDSLSVFSRESEWWREREWERERRRGWCINILSSVWGQGERTEERGKGWGGGETGGRESTWVSLWLIICSRIRLPVCVHLWSYVLFAFPYVFVGLSARWLQSVAGLRYLIISILFSFFQNIY